MTPEQTRLLVATPVRGAELNAAPAALGYMKAFWQLGAAMPTVVHFSFSLDVVRSRNRIVGEVLRSPGLAEVSHVLWWDDDQWPEDRSRPGVNIVVPLVRDMIALDLPIVGARYTNKLPQPRLREVHQEWGDGRVPDERGLLDVRSVGMGFTLVSRGCIEEMSEDARRTDDWYWDAPKPHDCPNLFGQLYDDFAGRRVLLSEDYSFCKRWRERHGGRVYVYGPSGIMCHAGMHAWSAQDTQ